jgi:Flp pilus assembly protein TadG
LQTSERGSAVAEFLLLTIPLVALASSTVGVSWYGFAKAQLTQIAAEGAMQGAQPDSTSGEVYESLRLKLIERLGIESFSATSSDENEVSTVAIELTEIQFLGPLSLVFPGLSVVSSAPVER